MPGRFPSVTASVTAPAHAASGCTLVAAPPTAGSVLATVVSVPLPATGVARPPTVGSVSGPVLATVVSVHAPAHVPDP